MNIIRSSRAFSRLLSLMVIGIFFLLVGCVETTTVEEIVLSSEEVILKIGEEKEITASVLPAEASQKVKWSSEDKAIATVNAGTIKGVAIGDTRVRVSAGEIEAFVEVSVIKENEDINLGIIDNALADANFLNYSVISTFKMTGTTDDNDIKTTVKVDGNISYTYLELNGEIFTTYTIAEGNQFYTLTYFDGFGEDWFVNTSDGDILLEIGYMDEFNIDDFTLENGYYVIKESKINEYLRLFKTISEFDEDNTITGMELKFKISSGKLMEMLYDIKLRIDGIDQELYSHMTFSEYGKTKVTVPQEVLDALAEYKAANE